MSRSLRRLPLVTIAAVALALAGCSGPSVPMQPAANANAPECADVTVRLPETVDGLELRTTNAQATGAWGSPATVLLHCGVATPEPTTDRCISLNGIDWVEDDADAPTYVYTTYGRSPAAQVTIDASGGTVSGTNVLMDLGGAIGYLPAVGGCVGPDDVIDMDDTKPPATTPLPEEPTKETSRVARNDSAVR
ncbi:hypothetical protein GCM10011490_13040 [Pseudoclavibacter endophyticus]|uniref:DUF3515 domain-containing protein n=1 Tax=Pseudoclavibacter endophyticus TaxID=1778590 RepID=A0A6H9WSK5_9MICO|nr:DUF3515 family protein [Pseudoclavibacter endophyticus]KAB1649290.1 DUF3515 domain-containing protein [Pseudoclavibacter endophyticus]GGA63819.1 hypothetical protein GCM10011490_13040 [Pseudoclavibacter endophyticus]